MFEVKQGQSIRIPVRFEDSTGAPVTGKTHVDVSVTVEKADGTTAAVATATAADFYEVTTGAFSGTGKYTLVLPTTATDVTGPMSIAVYTSGLGIVPILVVKVVANEEADTYAVATSRASQASVNTLSTDVAAIQVDVDALQVDVATVKTGVNKGLSYQEGKWQIHVAGADANRLVFYAADGTTVLKKFDLLTPDGTPTFVNPFQRVPVP